MRVVSEYFLKIAGEQKLNLPASARILHLEATKGSKHHVSLWALVDPDATTIQRTFKVIGTGQEFDEKSFKSDYIGSFVLSDGYAGHVVEIVG